MCVSKMCIYTVVDWQDDKYGIDPVWEVTAIALCVSSL